MGWPIARFVCELRCAFLELPERLFEEIGFKTAEDFSSGTLDGVQYCSSTIEPKLQQRDSSQTSFLKAASLEPNLHVFSATMAEKILFEGTEATVVKVAGLGLLPYTLKARK